MLDDPKIEDHHWTFLITARHIHSFELIVTLSDRYISMFEINTIKQSILLNSKERRNTLQRNTIHSWGVA